MPAYVQEYQLQLALIASSACICSFVALFVCFCTMVTINKEFVEFLVSVDGEDKRERPWVLSAAAFLGVAVMHPSGAPSLQPAYCFALAGEQKFSAKLDLVGLAYEDLGIFGSSLPSGRINAPEWRAMFAACVLRPLG